MEVAFWICSGLAIGSGVLASLSSNMRRVALSLWVCGLSTGGIFLSLGAEFIAVFQWIVSTLIGISFVFYLVLFGSEKTEWRWSQVAPSLVFGVLFLTIMWFGIRQVPSRFIYSENAGGLAKLGETLVSKHLLSVEILGVIVFLVVIGIGVVSRPEKKREGQES